MESDLKIRVEYQHARPKYNIGTFVFLRTDPEQMERMVVEIGINPNGISYVLALGDHLSRHYEIEVKDEKTY